MPMSSQATPGSYFQDAGSSIISATHDHKMLNVSDRVVWIRDGQVERVALREDLDIEVTQVGEE